MMSTPFHALGIIKGVGKLGTRYEWHCHDFCGQSELFALLYVKQAIWGMPKVATVAI